MSAKRGFERECTTAGATGRAERECIPLSAMATV